MRLYLLAFRRNFALIYFNMHEICECVCSIIYSLFLLLFAFSLLFHFCSNGSSTNTSERKRFFFRFRSRIRSKCCAASAYSFFCDSSERTDSRFVFVLLLFSAFPRFLTSISVSFHSRFFFGRTIVAKLLNADSFVDALCVSAVYLFIQFCAIFYSFFILCFFASYE